jgi:hypothetical protein
MRTNPAAAVLGRVATGFAFLIGIHGCAGNPPCKISTADVDTARAHAKAVEAKLEVASEERERLAKELEEAQAKQQEEQSRRPVAEPKE